MDVVICPRLHAHGLPQKKGSFESCGWDQAKFATSSHHHRPLCLSMSKKTDLEIGAHDFSVMGRLTEQDYEKLSEDRDVSMDSYEAEQEKKKMRDQDLE